MDTVSLVDAILRSSDRAEKLKRLGDDAIARLLVDQVWGLLDMHTLPSEIADEAARRLKARGFRAGEPDPVSPIDCQHSRTLHVQSASGGPPMIRESVSLCPDCGEFRVSAQRDGIHAVTRFTLPTDELVRAAGQYARFLAEEA